MGRSSIWYDSKQLHALQSYQKQGYFPNIPKSDIKRVYRVDSSDRHRLYRLCLSGVNLVSLCEMLDSPDIDTQRYAVEVISQNTRSLGYYLKSIMENQEFSLRKGYIDKIVFPEETIKRIRNIQKKN